MQLSLVNPEYLGVRFEYDKSLVSQIRELKNRRWNPKDKQWEIHIAHLPEIMIIFSLHPSQIDKRILDIYQKQWVTTSFRLQVDNVYTTIAGSDFPVDEIDNITSFKIIGSEFNPKYVNGTWDGKRHLLNKRNHSFPSGLLPKVVTYLKNQKMDYKIEDNRIRPQSSLRLKPPKIELREYQKESIDQAVIRTRGILEMATGSGKTVVAACIVSRLQLPTIFFVHTRELLYQTMDYFHDILGTEIGQVGDGIIRIKPVTIATIQTVIRALGQKYHRFDEEDEDDPTDISKQKEKIIKMVESYPVVFFDECHHLPSDTCYSVSTRCKSAFYRYGLSATPYRSDRQDMLIEAALGSKIYRANASVLIENHYLVPPRICFIPVINNGNKDIHEYNQIYREYVVKNQERNRIIVSRARQLADDGLTILILVQQVVHGKELLRLLPEAKFIQGADSSKKRIQALKEFKDKKLKILIATTLADEGLDVPTLGVVILAGGGKSETRALQRVGRALRTSSEKREAIVIDFFDSAPYLYGHSKNRLEIFKTEPRFKIEIEGDLPYPDSRNYLGGKPGKLPLLLKNKIYRKKAI